MRNAFIVIECRFRNIGLPPFYGLYNAILSVVMVMTLPLSAVVKRGFH